MKEKKKCDGVILENYRKGHVNGGTDTSSPLSINLEELAEANKLGVIAIPATATEDGYREVKSRYDERTAIFDLYNKTQATTTTTDRRWIDTPWPGLDVRAQAYFWCQVAKTDLIKGLIGGRSGSVDIAAFCGVKVLFWDEPWIDYVCSPYSDSAVVDGWKKRSPNNDEAAIVQIPQCLRSQQLMLLMGTAAPVRTPDSKFWGSFKVDVTEGDITKFSIDSVKSELKDWKLVRDRPFRPFLIWSS